jgi:hypothetical protein
METVTVSVRLRRVTKDDAQYAIDSMEEIFNEYDIPDETRLSLWEYYQVFASDVLLRFGEFSPEIGYPEHNGHDG